MVLLCKLQGKYHVIPIVCCRNKTWIKLARDVQLFFIHEVGIEIMGHLSKQSEKIRIGDSLHNFVVFLQVFCSQCLCDGIVPGGPVRNSQTDKQKNLRRGLHPLNPLGPPPLLPLYYSSDDDDNDNKERNTYKNILLVQCRPIFIYNYVTFISFTFFSSLLCTKIILKKRKSIPRTLWEWGTFRPWPPIADRSISIL